MTNPVLPKSAGIFRPSVPKNACPERADNQVAVLVFAGGIDDQIGPWIRSKILFESGRAPFLDVTVHHAPGSPTLAGQNVIESLGRVPLFNRERRRVEIGRTKGK